MRVGVLRDLWTDDFDHADGLEKGVLDFVDLSHAAGAEALDDPILSVDGFVRITAEEVCYGLATMWAGFEGTFDFSVTSDTAKWHAETNDTTWRCQDSFDPTKYRERRELPHLPTRVYRAGELRTKRVTVS